LTLTLTLTLTRFFEILLAFSRKESELMTAAASLSIPNPYSNPNPAPNLNPNPNSNPNSNPKPSALLILDEYLDKDMSRFGIRVRD
jgi:hypothetical protein